MNSVPRDNEAPRWAVWAGLAVVCAALFGTCIGSGTFIAHQASVLRLPLLTWWGNLPTLFSADFTVFSDGQYRPLGYACLAVLRTVVGWQNALFWHLLLAGFHWLNAVLVYAIARRFAQWWVSAALAAVIFCVHPAASVVVSNVNHFHYVLGLCAYLGAAYCYLAGKGRADRWRYAVGVGLFAVGLLTNRVVATLPLVLVAYEVMWQRSGLRGTLRRTWPYVVMSVGAVWLWTAMKPHPLYYRPMPVTGEGGWNSFMTIVGASGWYLRGWLLGVDVPIVLCEVVERISGLTHWRFWLWLLAHAGIMVWAGWRTWRKGWDGLGALAASAAMIPFVTVWWNAVEAYVSWEYLYCPLVGLGMLFGGVLDSLARRIADRRRWLVAGGIALVAVCYSGRLMRLNSLSRSPVGWWGEVLRKNPESERACVELGKACLARGDVEEAVGYLFSTAVRSIDQSSRAMAWHYLSREQLLPALIHAKFANINNLGLQFQHRERLLAALFESLGAIDHAEGVLGKMLMANPHNVDAMKRLASLWLGKGFVRAAQELVKDALRITPDDAELAALRLAARRARHAPSGEGQTIRPVSADWIRSLGGPRLTAGCRDAIVRASEQYPHDPMIQMAAIRILAGDRRRAGAPHRLRQALEHLESLHPTWAQLSIEDAWGVLRDTLGQRKGDWAPSRKRQ